jgi:hypothetical protein
MFRRQDQLQVAAHQVGTNAHVQVACAAYDHGMNTSRNHVFGAIFASAMVL